MYDVISVSWSFDVLISDLTALVLGLFSVSDIEDLSKKLDVKLTDSNSSMTHCSSCIRICSCYHPSPSLVAIQESEQ